MNMIQLLLSGSSTLPKRTYPKGSSLPCSGGTSTCTCLKSVAFGDFSTASEGFPEAWKGFRVSCGLVEVHDMGFLGV